MKIPYRTFLRLNGIDWYPLVPIRIGTLSRPTLLSPRFEALVDSGASDCLFQSDFGKRIGLAVSGGEAGRVAGISGSITVHYHRVARHLLGEVLEIRAGFTDHLPVLGLLGRRGFFDRFRVSFDPVSDPPGIELDRVHKS